MMIVNLIENTPDIEYAANIERAIRRNANILNTSGGRAPDCVAARMQTTQLELF